MKFNTNRFNRIGLSFLLLLLICFTGARAQKPVKVFIMAGQSNMVGHGETEKGEKGNLSWLVKNDTKGKYQHLVDKNGAWKVRDDIYVYAHDKFDVLHTGGLSIGYGAFETTIGPELQFGNVVGDYFDENVLLIKTAWGGKSLAVDFCPPSAVSDSGYVRIPYASKDTGYYYVQMLATIYDVLNNLNKYVPDYSGEGYEIAGFAWHQGWNDRINKTANAAYESNMVHLIKDVRRDLGTPNLPVVIATTGMRSYKENDPNELSLINAQLAVKSHPEFKGNVDVVDTRDFWRAREDSPAKQNYHWNRNAETYLLIGESMANAMVGMLKEYDMKNVSHDIRPAQCSANNVLLPTPPMGWNSWNAFEKDIDENKIKAVADIMVSSGMRDAGYKYLVLDDAWMDSLRNENGQLLADYAKFPGGMKAIGDYIHSKGLKFGIYECRGRVTCQNLPGSFEHEQTDMNSFAEWGVDYIKMDACFAAQNGRLSTEDFSIYHDAIKNTGRPMVFSISDFGQGAWAWGGKNYAELWRTSMDIYPYIKSVYKCAETSGGAGSIHPAFKGLWQFAGPDSWNDPDMLQIGNLKNSAEDKVHFSLWAILSAPLMAGNDLRIMSDTVKNILTASEVIAINQDSRAQQGYKVFEKDSIEIYNKPLADGTTAVLLLNKGQRKTDVTVSWKQIGLSGSQAVRDLWEQKDLGSFPNSFTAKNLEQHGHLLVKVGTVGSKPLPGPTPVSPEKYTVTKTGTTYLSDLYYIMKEFNHPVVDKNFQGDAFQFNGKTYEKGLGCKSKSIMMYKLDGKADRFQAVIQLDDASDDENTGKFRILNEDKFGGRVIFDSGQIKKGEPKTVDIDVKGLDFILLEFTGKGVFGNWIDAKVIANN
jgi:alpha-galactosidase